MPRKPQVHTVGLQPKKQEISRRIGEATRSIGVEEAIGQIQKGLELIAVIWVWGGRVWLSASFFIAKENPARRRGDAVTMDRLYIKEESGDPKKGDNALLFGRTTDGGGPAGG